MSSKQYFVYILASKKDGVLYIGITSNLPRRLSQHDQNQNSSFTQKYFVHRLVYVEIYDNPTDAIHREKNLKKWKREWKINLIKEHNPDWLDLRRNWL